MAEQRSAFYVGEKCLRGVRGQIDHWVLFNGQYLGLHAFDMQ